MTLGNLVIDIVKQLGVSHVFGVPGDYNLRFLDYIVESDGLTWIGNCNELNGSYAADGYARENGIGVLVTTCGVGELSAANGIAGSFAHNVSVLHIVGYPNSKLLESDAPVHHTLGNYRKNSFLTTFSAITGAQTILTATNYLEELQRVVLHMLLTKKPAYIGIPTDLIDMDISSTIEEILFYPQSNDAIIETLGNRILERFLRAQRPLFFLGANIARFGLRELMTQILKKTNAKFGTTLMGKSIINETSVAKPNFLGIYAGDYSTEGMVGIVQGSDCIISIGTVETDLNSGGFSEDGIDFENVITVRPYSVKVGKTLYSGINIETLLMYLEKHAKPNIKSDKAFTPPQENTALLLPLESALAHKDFWPRIKQNIIKEGDIVVAEAGSSLFGLVQQNLPAGIDFVSQILWASIGYTLPAAIGSAIASPHRRVLLFIGDGSFQLTAQEVSLIAQHQLNLTIFLINNNGYTIERAIHGAMQPYNDIPNWRYLDLVKSLGIETTFSIKTFKELEQNYDAINQTGPKVVELFFEPLDFPPLLKQISDKLAAANRK